MSSRACLFLFSILMVIGSLAFAAWLLGTRQADSFDGLFLFLSSLVIALSFSLYLKFLIRSAIDELAKKDILPKSNAPAVMPAPKKRTAA